MKYERLKKKKKKISLNELLYFHKAALNVLMSYVHPPSHFSVTQSLPVVQQSALLADSCQQDQSHVQDWTRGTGLEGGTGSVTVWR